jgi:galactokinase
MEARIAALLEQFHSLFGEKEARVWSAPGRTEIGGNHTDHQLGKAVAASVDMDMLAAAAKNGTNVVNVKSEGYDMISFTLDTLTPVKSEEGTTLSLIRGICAEAAARGFQVGGFDACITSNVLQGSGLSSSAAFEVLVAAILDRLYNRAALDFVTLAKIGQYAENVYFGKPSGLLDQMASAAGGLVTVDFRDTDKPEARALQYDFAKKGYSLVVVATGGSHADLTDCYAAIPAEMKAVAAYYGKPYLRGLTAEQLIANMDGLRKQVSDRALIRAFHFIAEDARVPEQVKALEEDRMDDFLRLIIDSGRSSFMYLQNIYARETEQSLSLALCMAEQMLRGRGAWRIHGGGFAGTTLNFEPEDLLTSFTAAMDRTFGPGAAIPLGIRPVGAAELKL